MSSYFEFEVSLLEVKPRIWRRFLLRTSSSFHELHDAIQRACGWANYHLYAFRSVDKSAKFAVSPHDEQEFGEVFPYATGVPLRRHLDGVGDKCIYEYDYGDGWEHLVEVVGLTSVPGQLRRKLVGGARAFPPEDCGGPHGYYECLEAFRITPEELARLDEDTREILVSRRRWFGDWDPERFDFEATAREMRRRVTY